MKDIDLQLLGFDVSDKEVLHMLHNDALIVNALNAGVPLAKIILIQSQRHSEDFRHIIELSSLSTRPIYTATNEEATNEKAIKELEK